MTDQNEPDPAVVPVARAGRWRRVLAGTGAVGAIAVALVWQARVPIADRFLRQALAEQGVAARYEIRRIGPRTQRLENVAIGDPAHPDLTARVVEVDLGMSGFSPVVRAIRVDGVRMRATYREGRLRLGALDRLRKRAAPGTGGLPPVDLALRDMVVSLSTDHGAARILLSGQGPLASGFRGNMAVTTSPIAAWGCAVSPLQARMAVRTAGGRLLAAGPLSFDGAACRGAAIRLGVTAGRIEGRYDPGGGAWQVAGGGAATMLAVSGIGLDRPSLGLNASGQAGAVRGQVSLTAPGVAGRGIAGRALVLNASGDGDSPIQLALQAENVGAPAALGALMRPGWAEGTPLEPLMRRAGAALGRWQGRNRLNVQGEWSEGRLRIRQAALPGASGGLVALEAGSHLWIAGPRDWALEGAVIARGDGLPDLRLRARPRADGGVSARLTLAPYHAAGAALAATPVLIERSARSAVSIRTELRLDGPLPGGTIRGLAAPVDLRLNEGGRAHLAATCLPVRWETLRQGALVLDAARIRLCDATRAPSLARTRLTGWIGASRLDLALDAARYDLARGRFGLRHPALRIGSEDSAVRLNADWVEGEVGPTGLSGAFGGGMARIGAVPLDLSELAGAWRFARGALAIEGRLRVADTQSPARFAPLHVPGARFTLAQGRIEAEGALRQPLRDRPVANVAIRHDLAGGDGEARLRVEELRFDAGLQPDDLTPLALGVVANVDGRVQGEGIIRWNPQGVTSTGRFATDGMAMAAAFGPVRGLTTNIEFTDLLGLVTAPGQRLALGSVNPGIEVRSGEVRYALLPSGQARIEGGRWPFAGGELELLPTTLDLDARKPRRITFRVSGLEAGAFIHEMALEDISATGTYDGLLPMIFDAQGGRIEGGILIARQQGLPPLVVRDAASLTAPCDPARQAGQLAYVGQVSNAQLGTMGRIAFDALKNLRYRCLTILLDGAVDGEFVTRVAINGINQGAPGAGRSVVTRAFLGLPFLFNVRIEAPFRGLINTARSFVDPSGLIRESLGPQYQTVLKAPLAETGVAVQPADSEKQLEGNRK